MKALVALAAAAALTGCAATIAPWKTQAMGLSAGGKCVEAKRMVYANTSDPAEQANYIGSVQADCDKDMAAAVRSWTLAARYGNSFAQRTLAELGQPVPSPDLAPPPQQSAAGAFADGLAQGAAWPPYYPPSTTTVIRQAPAATSMRCTTKRAGMFGDQLRTDCTPQ